MSMIVRIAERIVTEIPHSVVEGAKELIISPNPMTEPLIAPNPGAMEAALTLQASPLPQAITAVAVLALFGLTIWQIRKAVTPQQLNI